MKQKRDKKRALGKVLKITLSVLAALILLVVCTVLFWLGPTVKLAAEKVGSKALGTPVEIRKLTINPRKGVIHLTDLSIANQAQFGSSNAVSLASLDVAVDMASLFSPTILVHQVELNSPQFVFEQSGASDNIAEFIKNIYSFIEYDPANPPEPKKKKEKKPSGKEPPVVIVELLKINDVQFRLAHTDNPGLSIAVGAEELALSMTNGVARLSGFYLQNPANLTSTNLFSVEGVSIALAPESIYTPPLKFTDVQIDSPHGYVEWARDATTIGEFLEIAEDTAMHVLNWPLPAPSTNQAEIAVSTNTPPAPPPELQNLTVNDVQFHLVNSAQPELSITAALENVGVNLESGELRFNNLSLSNPGSLETPDLFRLGGLTVRIDPTTLYSKPLSVLDIQLNDPHLFIETKGKTGTVSEFVRIAETVVSSIPTAPPAFAAAKPADSGKETPPEIIEPAPPVELHCLAVNGFEFHIVNSADPKLSIKAALKKLEANLAEGGIRLDQFTVSNPERLETPNLFSLSETGVQIDPATLHSGIAGIRDILLREPHVFLEANRETDTVKEFMKIAAAVTETIPTNSPLFAASEPSPEALAAAAAFVGPPEPFRPPVSLGRLQIDDIQVKLLENTKTNAPAGLQLLAGIGSVSAEMNSGELQIKGIRVPNPAGFAATNLFHLENIGVSFDPASLFTGQVSIKEIFVNSPLLNLEQTEHSGNAAELRASILAFVPPPAPPSSEPQPASTNPPVALADQPVILHSLVVTNLAVNLSLPPSTNRPSLMAQTDRLKEAVSLKKLNPMNYVGEEKTNAVEEINMDWSKGPITLVRFDRLSVEPLKGLVYLDNLDLANAPGFSNKRIARIAHFRLDLQSDSLHTDRLIIEDILVESPEIAYERKIRTDNFKALQAEIEHVAMERKKNLKTADKKRTEPGEDEQENTAGNDEKQKVIIEHLLIRNATVKAKLSALPAAKIRLTPNPEMTGIGKDKGGATLADAGKIIYESLYSIIISAVANTAGIAGDTLKGAGNLTFDAVDTLTLGLTEGITGKVGGLVGLGDGEEKREKKEAPEEAKEKTGLKGLFKKEE